MTVLSFQWLLTWPRRAATLASDRGRARRLARRQPPGRRPYPDSFFADPVAVEDDTRRMRSGPAQVIWK